MPSLLNNFHKGPVTFAEQLNSNPTQPQERLKNYLDAEKGLCASSVSGSDKQLLLNSIASLNLTTKDARDILTHLNSNTGSCTEKQKLVIDVLNKLKNDHRSLLFHYGSTSSYKIAISFLTNLQNGNVQSIIEEGHGALGLFGTTRYSIINISNPELYSSVLQKEFLKLVIPDINIFEYAKMHPLDMMIEFHGYSDNKYYIEALTQFHQQNFEAGMEIIQTAAENNMNAMINLGECYERGIGVNRNEKQAFDCYQTAIEAGNPMAMVRLGRCYERGIGVNRNEEQAFEWYKKAVETGNTDAMINLGECYERGIGVDRNDGQAFDCYQKAIEAGNSMAMVRLGRCYECGVMVKKDPKKAFDCYQKAVNMGNTDAMFNLGVFYECGRGVKKDPKKAFDCYQKAAAFGNTNAMFTLGTLYGGGIGVNRNEEEAIKWFNRGNHAEGVATVISLSSNSTREQILEQFKIKYNDLPPEIKNRFKEDIISYDLFVDDSTVLALKNPTNNVVNCITTPKVLISWFNERITNPVTGKDDICFFTMPNQPRC